jgi:hypothetical protein
LLHVIVENKGGGDRYDDSDNASGKKSAHDISPASRILRTDCGINALGTTKSRGHAMRNFHQPTGAAAYARSRNASVSISMKVRPSAPTLA